MLVSECMLLFANVHAVLCCAAMCCAVQYGAVWSGGAVSCWVVPRDTALPRCLAFFFGLWCVCQTSYTHVIFIMKKLNFLCLVTQMSCAMFCDEM